MPSLPPQYSPRAPADRWWRIGVAIVVLGFIAGLVDLAMHSAVSGTAWNLGHDAAPFRIYLLSHGLSRGWLVALPLGVACIAANWGSSQERTVGRRFVHAAAWAVGLLVCFVWATSWSLFSSTGQFLDLISVRMGLTNPIQMTRHAIELAPRALVIVPLAAGGLWELSRRSVRWSAGWPMARGRATVAAGTLLLAMLVVIGQVGGWLYSESPKLATHPEGGIGTTVGGLYRQLQRHRSGPLAHMLAVSAGASGMTDLRPGPEAEQVEWRPRAPYASRSPSRPHNVVVLVVESLRSDELSAYGSPREVMPNVDQLANESRVFLNNYTTATHSNYSSVVPISSQFPLWDPVLHVFPENPSLPPVRLYDVLKPMGYRTAIISSQNEHWGGMANYLQSPSLDHFLHAETYEGPKYVPSEDVGFLDYVRSFGRSGKIDDQLTIDEAIRWIDESDQPFVTYINLQNSHVPYPVPAGEPMLFGHSEPSFPIGFNRFPTDSADVVRGVYRNSLQYVDRQVGRLLDHLDVRGLSDETIFVLTGDHGQAFFEHGFAAHGNELYEELLKTPLLIRAPGLDPSTIEALAQHVDIAPTILGLLGLAPHPGFQGRDVVNGSREHAYTLVQTSMAHQYAIVSDGFKLVFDPGTGVQVLRDLGSDPTESRDASASYPDLTERLRGRLDS